MFYVTLTMPMIHLHHHARRLKHHFRNAFVPHEGNNHRPHALRHKALTTYAIAIILVKIAVSGLVAIYPSPSATSNLTPQNIIELTNAARTSHGLLALKPNASLSSASQSKGNDMLTKGYFAHISPTNVTPWYWLKRAGYNYNSAGENLAMDFLTAEDVTEAWLASPGHRKNILNGKYADIGVAVVTGNLKGVSTTIVVQFFGTPTVVKQQPKKVVKVTPPQPKAQPQKSTVAKVAIAAKPAPVLGEDTTVPEPVPAPEPVPVAPLQPKLTSPNTGEIIATNRPWLGGEAEANILVYLYQDGAAIGQTISDENGYFRTQPSQDINDGKHVLTAVAAKGNLTSRPSAGLELSVDTQPPSVALSSLTVLPALATPGGYTIFGNMAGEDIAEAQLMVGTSEVKINARRGRFMAVVTPKIGDDATEIVAKMTDTVGNVSIVPVASTTFMDRDILIPQSRGWIGLIPNIVFFSRRFFLTLWLFVFLALAINILVRIQVQHRATILYSLLLLYGLTIVMIV